MNILKLTLCFALSLMFLIPVAAHAIGPYYVDKATGNDDNNGSISSPWKTLHRAMDGVSVYEVGGGAGAGGCGGASKRYGGGSYSGCSPNAGIMPAAGDTVYVLNGIYEDNRATLAIGDAAFEVPSNGNGPNARR